VSWTALAELWQLLEARGRGWQVWPYAVELEPPFRPFIYHYVPQGPPVDDGRRPTLLGSLAEGVQGLFASRKQQPAAVVEEYLPEEEPLPEIFVEQGQVAEFRVALPKGMGVDREAMERCLSAVGLASRPVSYCSELFQGKSNSHDNLLI